ncbi:hypothetical protein FPQ18DRAFT_143732 [Pyronema domesticum]|nr:hypothetical protein FPQ18DRAFT_143732 [Pyronema domesticum]
MGWSADTYKAVRVLFVCLHSAKGILKRWGWWGSNIGVVNGVFPLNLSFFHFLTTAFVFFLFNVSVGRFQQFGCLWKLANWRNTDKPTTKEGNCLGVFYFLMVLSFFPSLINL